jgi:hypothetical protein
MQEPTSTWSLDDVPSDPEWEENPSSGLELDSPKEPPMMMDKDEALRLTNDPKMRKILEKYSQSGKVFLPRNPPEMNEESAAILPKTNIVIPDDSDIDYFDFDDECPTQNCPEDE